MYNHRAQSFVNRFLAKSVQGFKPRTDVASKCPFFAPNQLTAGFSYWFLDASSCNLLRSKGLVINYGEGGYKNGKIAGPKLFAPPPQDRVKLFVPPLLKSGNFSCSHYNMAKTSSYYVKTTPKLFVPPPPLQHG